MRVVVTRPEEQAGPLAARLVALGHEVVLYPLLRIDPLGDEPIDVGGYDWVVVTSRTGAAELARRASGPLPRVAAIGPGTAAALADCGITAAFVAGVSTQEGLVAAFPHPAGRVLFAGAEGARRIVVDELGADFLALYRTVETPAATVPVGDVAVVASPSAARALGAALSAAVAAAATTEAPRPGAAALPVVSIGPQTSAAARAAGLEVVAEAGTHDLDGLLAAIVAVAEARAR